MVTIKPGEYVLTEHQGRFYGVGCALVDEYDDTPITARCCDVGHGDPVAVAACWQRVIVTHFGGGENATCRRYVGGYTCPLPDGHEPPCVGGAEATATKATREPKVGDPCVCGHDRGSHIYHEGPCRPGYRCLKDCKAFVLDRSRIGGPS